ncbi:helicase SRCAP isoform X2 [Gadus morhua]|uniref:helicase SRCAP isoform X2 n=1 Tax=Gadus morhua TaxID=8049 RepID=UPI0011B3AA44|nr:helicase SRCAP-like isoform X2 [Gadus morhua]
MEYNSETRPDQSLCGGEHTITDNLPQAPSPPCPSASSPDRQRCVANLSLQDAVMEQSTTAAQQTDAPTSQPQIISQGPSGAGEPTGGVGSMSVGIQEHATELSDSAHKQTLSQPPSSEVLENAGPGETVSGAEPCAGEQSTASVSTAEVEPAESSGTVDTYSVVSFTSAGYALQIQPPSAPNVLHPDPAGSSQAEAFVELGSAALADQISTVDVPMISEMVHSSETQRIVIVGDPSHLGGDWSEMHVNQSYLVQQEDGSICEASVVNDLSSGQPKLYGEGLQLDSQPVVYEICSLVEGVAEETICVSSTVQPHSPGYEVNLFNALLDHSEEYPGKEGLSLHMEAPLCGVSEADGVLIAQQAFPLSGASAVMSHNVSISHPGTAALGSRLVSDISQAVQVPGLSELCVVTASSEQHPLTPRLPADAVVSYMVEAPSLQMGGPEPSAGSSALVSPVQFVIPEEVAMDSSLAVSIQTDPPQCPGVTVENAVQLGACGAPSDGGTKDKSTLSRAATPETASPAVNRKFLPHTKSPLLGQTPSVLSQVPEMQNSAEHVLANAHSLRAGSVSEECLPKTVSLTDPVPETVAVGCQSHQAQRPVNRSPAAAPSTEALCRPTTENACHGTLHSNSDNEALTAAEPSTGRQLPGLLNVASSKSTAAPSAPQSHGASPATLEAKAPSLTAQERPDAQSYFLCEGEEMEQEGSPEEAPSQEPASGEASSEEEGSEEEEEESECDKTDYGITTPSPANQVRRWIADRVVASASPASPFSSSPSPGPSSASDWSTPRERASLLRGPHGKFLSPSCSSSPTDQTTPHRPRGEKDMAERAKHEADIEHRSQSLKKEGYWSTKRLTRLTEPVRPKVHWDYLCEEMQWLSADFAQERRWKRGVARKVVRMVMRYHEDLRQKEEKAKRDEHSKVRRIASSIAKEVRAFWSSVEKVVQYKQQSRLEEKRKKALDLQLDFIVGQTEKYSDLLSQSLAPAAPTETPDVQPKKPFPTAGEDDGDRDFEPPGEEEDDEETIDVEEQQEGNDAESQQREIELLKQEGELPLEDLLRMLKGPADSASEEGSDDNSTSVEEEDGEFNANEEDAEDQEDTIDAQEKVEGTVDHAEELDDLAKEGDMSMDELLEKYKGAYTSDFEEPSASASKASSDSEVSGDDEVETEEDESDAETNSSSSDSPEDSEEEDSEKDEEQSDEEEEDEEEGSDEDSCGDEGMEVLLKEGDNSPPSAGSRPKKEISHIAATAESLQPKGYTLATTKVKTPIPFLLDGTLREYQHIGLDWLVTMYEKKLNGILADEMGLGKTIQTIALLAHLACEKGNWGPHLIIVPTSVMLNWEMELKRWCPGFKILTYFGSQKERKMKRQGWTKPNAFHVCVTSYKLVLQDHQAFRRKSWRYLILDEAQNIKNFKSQRWQSLLNFNSHRRLLLTGTPLQNSLMELWSLMHFLMPHVFQSHREFKEWFSNPLTGMIEGSQEYNEGLIKRLHKVLRPFLLRRIKVDVEKQMPKKYEHVVRCRLSKRQRFLYDDFMAQAAVRETLASGHFMSVINILMQLRKVCNHPNLFDPRPIQSPFITKPIVFRTASLVQDVLEVSPLKRCDLSMFDLLGLEGRVSRYRADVFMPRHKVGRQLIQEIMEPPEPPPRPKPVRMKVNRTLQPPPKTDSRPVLLMNKPTCPVPPAAQTPKAPSVAETPPPPAPVVQQVVCSVATTPPPPRPLVHPNPQTAVRSSGPRPILTVRAPSAPGAPSVPAQPTPIPSQVLPQRVLLSPDMQARLPSGEVVSIAQLASLAGRPMSSCQGSKPVTFQLQGNKLTLSGAQIHHVPMAPPRQVQVTSSMVSSPGIVKIVVRQATGKEGGTVPTLAVAPSPRVAPLQFTPVRTPLTVSHRTPGPATATYTMAPPRIPSASPALPQPPRTILKVVQAPPPPVVQSAPVLVTPSSSSSSPSMASTSTSKSSAVAPRDTSVGSKPAPPPKASPASRAPPWPRVPTRAPRRSLFYLPSLAELREEQHRSKLDFLSRVNDLHCGARPIYGLEVLDFLTFLPGSKPSPAPVGPLGEWGRSGHTACLLAQSHHHADHWVQSRALKEAIHSPEQRLNLLYHMIDRFTFVIPPVEAAPITMHCCHPPPSLSHKQVVFSSALSTQLAPLTRNLHRIQCNMRTHFPDLRLIQYDCGKLQTLHTLLRRLKTGGHRVLIFTQMTRMLDVLEQFLNYHGHIYLRLDGSTRVEMRQSLMERFNNDRRIFCFILSTRSGGVGVNLTGADTVVFYDSDWNPTMDAQAQDRCHRIGQTRDVHIYRLISERTVEENILKKANQKRMLGDMAIDGGNFTTAFFKEQTIRELFDVNEGEKKEAVAEVVVVAAPQPDDDESAHKQSTTILEQALCRAEDEEDIVAASQAKAEQVAELAEFNENIPLDDGGDQEEVEELSKAEQEIAALVEQLTPIERYAMNFLEASLEDVCKEELKQAEEQVEAARKGLDQAKEEGLKHNASSDDDASSPPASAETPAVTPARRGRKPKDKSATSTRTSGRLRGASPEPEPSPPPAPREVPERPRSGLRGRPPSKDSAAAAAAAAAAASPPSTSTASPTRADPNTKSPASSKHAKDSSPTREPTKGRTLNRAVSGPVPSPAPSSPAKGRPQTDGPTEGQRSAAPEPRGKEERPEEQVTTEREEPCSKEKQANKEKVASEEKEKVASEEEKGASKEEKVASKEKEKEEKTGTKERSMTEVSPLESNCPVDHQMYSAREDTTHMDALGPIPVSSSSRSPRKRQSADGEVLKGLSEDSPSAKVLRKLPGRLVTVVTDKEPRKRRRRASGTGGHGSSEEAAEEQTGGSASEPGRDAAPQSPESKPKGPPGKDMDHGPALPTPQPRGYHPYSPPHASPDMPVLRNLPVRRRLETESRMAAQLSEQQHQLGRGRGAGAPRKTDTPPGRDPAAAAAGTAPSENSVAATPVKRKRGRPPKTPPSPLVQPLPPPPPPKAEASPTISPKRRRGRPRKDASLVADITGQKPNNKTTASPDPGSKTAAQKPGSSQVQSPPAKPLPAPPVKTVVYPSKASLPSKPLPSPPVVGPIKASMPSKPLPTPPAQSVVGPSQASLPSKPLPPPTVKTVDGPSQASKPLPTPPAETVVGPSQASLPSKPLPPPTVKTVDGPSQASKPLPTPPAETVVGPSKASLPSKPLPPPPVQIVVCPSQASLPSKPLPPPPIQIVVGPSQASLPSKLLPPPPLQIVVGPSQASLPSKPLPPPPIQIVVGPSQASLPSKPLSTAPVETVVGPSQASLPSKLEKTDTMNTSGPAASVLQPSPIYPSPREQNPKPSPTNLSGPVAEPARLPVFAPPPPSSTPPASDLITTTAVPATVPNITTASAAIPAAKQALTAPTPSEVNGGSTTIKTSPPIEKSMPVSTTSSSSTTASTPAPRPLHATPSDVTSVEVTSDAAAVSAPPTKGCVTLSKTNCSALPACQSTFVKNMAPSSAQPSATPTPPSGSTTSTSTHPIMETATSTAPPTEGPASAVMTSATTTTTTTTSSPTSGTSHTAAKSSAVEKAIAIAPSLSTVNQVTEPAGPTTTVPEEPITNYPPKKTTEEAATAAPLTTLTQATSLAEPVMVNSPASSTVSRHTNITTQATSAKTTTPPPSSKGVEEAEQRPGGTLSTSTTVAATPQGTSSPVAAQAPLKSASASSSSTAEPTTVAMPTEVSPNTQDTPATAAVPGSTETATGRVPRPATAPAVVPSPVQKEASHGAPPEASASAQTEGRPQGPAPAPSADCLAPSPPEPVSNMESEKEARKNTNAVEANMDSGAPLEDDKAETSSSQPEKNATECSEAKAPPASPRPDSKPTAGDPRRGSKQESDGDERASGTKRSQSRQSSRDSARSSSPSSGCSTATLTRRAHHRKTYENRHPTKKRRLDASPEPGGRQQEKARPGREQAKKHPAASQRRPSRSPSSSSSSSSSDRSSDRKEHRLTRSAKRGLQGRGVGDGNRPRKRTTRSSERRNAAVSTGGESGSDASSGRTTGKHVKPPANSVPPEPEVLGKRCSALNAAAKLLAMKGRVDTPGHTLRKDPRAAGSSPAADKKPKSKSLPATPQTNSVNSGNSRASGNNRASGSKPSTPGQSGRASRSTRRCPGSLLPPLEGTEYKRSRGKKEGKEGESSRGHSACSSGSGEGGGGGGGRSSRSRSSSGSSRRSPSLSSQSTGPRGSRSRAASSGSEHERSSERRSTRRDRKDRGSRSGEGRRESRRSSRRSHKLSQEASSSSGAEGTPDRVLRSVAALAAVHARSPAASTRSSFSTTRSSFSSTLSSAASTRSSFSSTQSSAGQQRHNKT